MLAAVVTAFGADSSGASDAADAINDALRSAAHVYIPPGMYRIPRNKSIVVPSGATLSGAGQTARLFRPGQAPKDALNPDPPVVIVDKHGSRVSNIAILGENGSAYPFDGDGWAYQTAAIHFSRNTGENPSGSYRNLIDHVWVENFFGFPIHAPGEDFFTTIAHCTFRNCANGLNPSGNDGIFYDCLLENAEGIEVFGDRAAVIMCRVLGRHNSGITMYGDGIRCTGNLVDQTDAVGQDVAQAAFIFAGCRDGVIAHNVAKNPPLRGFSLQPNNTPGADIDPRGLSFSHNKAICRRASQEGPGLVHAFSFSGASAGRTARNISVDHNHVIADDTGAGRPSYGFSCFYLADFSFDHNDVHGARQAAFHFANCTEGRITSNLASLPNAPSGAAGFNVESSNRLTLLANRGRGAPVDGGDLVVNVGSSLIKELGGNTFGRRLILGDGSQLVAAGAAFD